MVSYDDADTITETGAFAMGAAWVDEWFGHVRYIISLISNPCRQFIFAHRIVALLGMLRLGTVDQMS